MKKNNLSPERKARMLANIKKINVGPGTALRKVGVKGVMKIAKKIKVSGQRKAIRVNNPFGARQIPKRRRKVQFRIRRP